MFAMDDVIEIVTLVSLLGGGFWRFSTILGSIQRELALIQQTLSTMAPTLADHESRLRALERQRAAVEQSA
jgi:hypothetical protein